MFDEGFLNEEDIHNLAQGIGIPEKSSDLRYMIKKLAFKSIHKEKVINKQTRFIKVLNKKVNNLQADIDTLESGL